MKISRFRVRSTPGKDAVILEFRCWRYLPMLRVTVDREGARRIAGAMDRAAVHGG